MASEMLRVGRHRSPAFSGDWFEEFGTRFDIQNALLGATGAVWIFQVRRQIFDPATTVENSSDYGNLTVHASSQDLGDLELWDAEVRVRK
jgi:hypothetical protein